MRLQLLPMARGLRAVAAGRHIAPPAPAVLRVIEEHALASRIGAAAYAHELTEDQRVGRRLDDGDDESGERVADGHEGADEGSVRAEVDAPRSSAAAEDAVDLDETFVANAFTHRPALGERAERRADAAAVDESHRCAGRLLLRAAPNSTRALGVEDGRRFQPPNHTLEITQRVEAPEAVLAVHEVEP